MSAVGRNEACPRGSGRKFKKCCLSANTTAAGSYTPGERRDALDALFRFAARGEFEDDRAIADTVFWADRFDDLTDEEADRVFDLEQSHAAFQEWFAFDFRLESDRTVLDVFLERHGDRLRSGELRCLERIRRTHVRLYEVAAIRLDEGLDLVDLWTQKRIRVSERMGTRQLAQWDVIAARVMRGPRGDLVLEGAPYLYPVEAKERIVKALRRAHRELAQRFPEFLQATGSSSRLPRSHAASAGGR